MNILINTNRHTVIQVSANTVVNVAGNSSVSDIATNDDEIVLEGYIKQIWYGSPSGNGAYWTISRGSNTLLVVDSTGWLDFSGNGDMLKMDADATLDLKLTGSTAGTLIVDIRKSVLPHPGAY